MIAILDYKAGNTLSVANAVRRLGYDCIITEDEALIASASKVILPGVGEASNAMANLISCGLDKLIPTLTQPVLGICLGLQLMCESTTEGDVQCLGIFDTQVIEFPPKDKVPHMGWNEINNLKDPLFDTIQNNADVYFVHSYYAKQCDQTVATCTYMVEFSAAIRKDNFIGMQFHPEKSGPIGEIILSNFLKS